MFVFLTLLALSTNLEPILNLPLEGLGVYRPTLEHPMLAVNDNGNVVLADQNGPRLLFLDAQGNLRKTLAKKGSGPGEFQRIDMVCRTKDGLAVWDGLNRRLTLLSASGTFLSEKTFTETIRQPFMSAWNRFFFVRRDRGADLELDYFLRVQEAEGNTRDLFSGSGPSAVMMKWIPRMEFGVGRHIAAANMGTTTDMSIIDLSSGEQKTISLDLPAVAVSRKFYDDEMRAMAGTGKGPPPGMVPQPENWPTVRNISIDDQQRIWVFGWQEPATKARFLVLDRNGKILHQGLVAGDVQVVQQGYLYAVYMDKEDELYLRKYHSPLP